jgi:hypothetical protein
MLSAVSCIRQRTPSGLKWVANELAAIAGELERIDEQMTVLCARRARLEDQRASLDQVGALMGAPELKAVLQAVRVHTAYGGRGCLVDWVRAVLQAVAPGPLDTRALVILAEEQFGLELPTQDARDRYRKNSLGRALRKLRAEDQVERIYASDSTGGPGLWQWKTHRPELSELLTRSNVTEAC